MISHLRCLKCHRRRKPSHEKQYVKIGGCNLREIDAQIVWKYRHLDPRKVGS